MLALLPLSLGTLAAILVFVQRRDIHLLKRTSLILSILTAVGIAIVAVPVIVSGALPTEDSFSLIDPLSGLLGLLIALLYIAGTIVSIHYLTEERHAGSIRDAQIWVYFVCLHLFVVAMLAAVFLSHTLLVWVALEATTLSTVLLVSFYGKEGAVEAAWKYIVLCSTGIALGLMGILFALHAAAKGGVTIGDLFSFTVLRAHASTFDPMCMRLSFIFLLVGFGTKVGFVPMHTWLPDAHSKTPAPVSAMLSGILLSVALAALLRFKLLTDLALGSPDWTNTFFLVFGLASVVLPAFILLIQNNYKRMLAYSSIEHMGLIGILIGFGPAGAAIAMIHLIGHALAKSLLFFGAGEIILRFHSTKMENVHSMLRLEPILAVLFLSGVLALLGLPPSPVFASEFFLVKIGITVHPVLTIIVLASLAMIFVSMLRSTMYMCLGGDISPTVERTPHVRWNATHFVMLTELIVLCIVGIFFLTDSGLIFASSIARSFLPTP